MAEERNIFDFITQEQFKIIKTLKYNVQESRTYLIKPSEFLQKIKDKSCVLIINKLTDGNLVGIYIDSDIVVNGEPDDCWKDIPEDEIDSYLEYYGRDFDMRYYKSDKSLAISDSAFCFSIIDGVVTKFRSNCATKFLLNRGGKQTLGPFCYDSDSISFVETSKFTFDDKAFNPNNAEIVQEYFILVL